MKKQLIYAAGLVLLSLGLGRLIWFLPGLLLLSGIVVHSVNNPLRYLVFIAVGAELTSVLPLGVAAMAVLAPWLVKQVGRHIDVDVSFSYLLLIILTVTVQMLILFLPDSINTLRQQSWSPASLFQVVDMMPWLKATTTLVLTALFIYGVNVLLHFNRSW